MPARHSIVAVLGAAALTACNANPSLAPSVDPGIGSPLLAASAVRADPLTAADHEVPFKGQFAGRLSASVPAAPPLLSNLIEAGGESTQLGRFTLAIPHLVNTTTRGATGAYEFTPANRDELGATFTGVATVLAPGVVSVLDTATITGGTGRFENATGHFTVERIFTFATGEVTATFEGVITAGAK